MIHKDGIRSDMIANNLMPYLEVHPGEIIKDEIESRGISQRALAKQIEVSYSVLNEILNGKRPVTTQYAMLLEAALGIDAGFFVRMQADYDMQVAKQNKQLSKKIAAIRKMTAVL
ncbi:MAG: addiction module antidote protein, HigA family [Bacteroidales bacterium 36-12]|nr:MAG: addiction module antidote protein, HigA family [Bacteroidales bacterium 36-12]